MVKKLDFIKLLENYSIDRLTNVKVTVIDKNIVQVVFLSSPQSAMYCYFVNSKMIQIFMLPRSIIVEVW